MNDYEKLSVFRHFDDDDHTKIIDYLQMFGLNGDECNYYIFRRACSYGYIKTLKVLNILGVITSHVQNNIPFRHACSYGHIDVAQRLYDWNTDMYSNEAIKWTY